MTDAAKRRIIKLAKSGMSQSEIADAMQLTKNQVAGVLYRAGKRGEL